MKPVFALIVGCCLLSVACSETTSVGDESEGWITEAQTFGAPGFPMPEKMVKDDNDVVLPYGPEDCASVKTLNAQCNADEGTPITVSYRRNRSSEECPFEFSIGCLFKVPNDL